MYMEGFMDSMNSISSLSSVDISALHILTTDTMQHEEVVAL